MNTDISTYENDYECLSDLDTDSPGNGLLPPSGDIPVTPVVQEVGGPAEPSSFLCYATADP